MAQALVDGGVQVLEITLRTPMALNCMEAIARAVPGAIVGAGTVRSIADAQAAQDAGCLFARQPGLHQRDRPAPAATSACRCCPAWPPASEVMRANADGYDFLKFFPATAAGGIPHAQGAGRPVRRRGVLPDRRHHARDARRSSWRCRT